MVNRRLSLFACSCIALFAFSMLVPFNALAEGEKEMKIGTDTIIDIGLQPFDANVGHVDATLSWDAAFLSNVAAAANQYTQITESTDHSVTFVFTPQNGKVDDGQAAGDSTSAGTFANVTLRALAEVESTQQTLAIKVFDTEGNEYEAETVEQPKAVKILPRPRFQAFARHRD